jgi:anti-sigma factor RsiW
MPAPGPNDPARNLGQTGPVGGADAGGPSLPPASVCEERLSAWVDGEGSPVERATVQAWVDTHPEDAERARQWQADRTALFAALAGGAASAVDPLTQRLQAQVWRGSAAQPEGVDGNTRADIRADARVGTDSSPSTLTIKNQLPRRWPLAAAAAAMFALGGAVGGAAVWGWHQQAPGADMALLTPQGWVQRAAFAHSVYVPEPRHPVEVKAQEEHLSRWLTNRVAVPVKLFNLREQGFELVGGRLLPDGAGKSAQLMYEDAQKVRVTVYLRKPEKGTEAAFRYERSGDVGMFYWVEDNCGYALVGNLPRERLLALAQAIYKQEPQGALPK